MANPRNNVTLSGKVGKGGVRFLSGEDGDGHAFACMFTLVVQRNFRNKKGKYDSDPIPIKYTWKTEACMKFAYQISEGDGLLVSGTLRVEQGKTFVHSEEVSYDDLTMSKKYKAKAEEWHKEGREKVIQKPLPY